MVRGDLLRRHPEIADQPSGRLGWATTSAEGRNPTPPQSAAGRRSEPPVSEPVQSGSSEVARAAAEPPEEPIEPATMRDRMGFPGRLGAGRGFMLGMIGLVAATAFLFDKVSLAGTEEDPSLVWVVSPARALLRSSPLS